MRRFSTYIYIRLMFNGCITSKKPVPQSMRRPMAMRDDGDAIVSWIPCSVEPTKNLDVVSNDICVMGEPWLPRPMRFRARKPPWQAFAVVGHT